MKYKNIPGISKPLSQLIYGTNSQMGGTDTQAAIEILDTAYSAGFRTIDTAHAYGNSEKNIGNWMALRGIRDQIVLLDKGCNPLQAGSLDIMSAKTIRTQFEQSLNDLQTDHVEMYALHRDDPSVSVDEIVEVLNELHSEGKILQFGVSNWTLDRILQANKYAELHGLMPFSFVSPAYSLAVYEHDPWGGSVALSTLENESYRSWLTHNQMPVCCYSSLARGFLSGKYHTDNRKPIEECIGSGSIQEYLSSSNLERLSRVEKLAAEKGFSVPQIALAWLLEQPMNLFPLISPSSPEHIEELIHTFDVKLTSKECNWLLNGIIAD